MSKDVLQTRYDFHHNKRFYKLGELWKKREEQRILEQEKAYQRLQEKRQQQNSARGGDQESRVPSQHGGNRSNMNVGGNIRKPSSMNVQGGDYNSAVPSGRGGKGNKNLGLPNVGRLDAQSRMNSQSRMRNPSRMNVQEGGR